MKENDLNGVAWNGAGKDMVSGELSCGFQATRASLILHGKVTPVR